MQFCFLKLLSLFLSPSPLKESAAHKQMGRLLLITTILLSLESTKSEGGNIFQPRIIGGSTAGNYPWFSVLLIRSTDGTAMCGGSLIQPDVILTAAHCWDPDKVDSIRAIVNFRSTPLLGNEESRFVSQMIAHPEWSTDTHLNDILLLKLDFPIETFDVASLSSTSPMTGEIVKAIGYGATSDKPSPDVLQQVDIPVVASNDCNDSNSYNGEIDPALQLCAGTAGKDTCQGDSGGPLLNSAGAIVGITSMGIGCALENFPGIYTRVSYYQGWIEQTLCEISAYATALCSTAAPTRKPTSAPITTAPSSSPESPRVIRTRPPRDFSHYLALRSKYGRAEPEQRSRPERGNEVIPNAALVGYP